MLRLGIDPEKLYRATFICQDGLYVFSLRSKRFQSSYWAKVRAGAKKKVEGGGGGEKRRFLHSPPPPPPPSFLFFCSGPNFLDEHARKRLLRRLICCFNMALISFRLFRKNLGNLPDFFGQMVYPPPPPWQKNSRTPMKIKTIILT